MSTRHYTHTAYFASKKRAAQEVAKRKKSDFWNSSAMQQPFGIVELAHTADYLRSVEYHLEQGGKTRYYRSRTDLLKPPPFNPIVLSACLAMDIGVAMVKDVVHIKDLVTRKQVTQELKKDLAKLHRPKYYAADNARRRALAAERRKITKRTTTSPMPEPEQILEAWKHRKDSKEAMIHLGGMMQDLECYVDNTLKFDEYGNILGRRGGIRSWLKECVPELFPHYKTLMRYKAMAKQLRQVTKTADPKPTEALLTESPRHPILNEICMRKSFTAEQEKPERETFIGIMRVLEAYLKPTDEFDG